MKPRVVETEYERILREARAILGAEAVEAVLRECGADDDEEERDG